MTASVRRPGHFGFALCLASALAAPAGGQLLVNSTKDPGLGACTVAQCTLRDAITQLNSGAFSLPISFSIPASDTGCNASGVCTIKLASALPAITKATTIDGYTQPGSSVNTLATGDNAVLKIALDGSSLGGAVCGLDLRGGNSTVRGLIVGGFAASLSTGLCFSIKGNNLIEGNFVGVNAAGTGLFANYDGVSADLDADGNTLGGIDPAARNVVSGNSNRGLVIDSANNIVQGNLIGTDRAGTGALGNGSGIVLFDHTTGSTFGGTTVAARNVISGNLFWGILFINASANTVTGNDVGVDVTGAARLGNAFDGISIQGNDNVIGGAVSGAGNVISANGFSGVSILSGTGNLVQGNFVGTDSSAAINLGNAFQGIASNGSQTTIGGGNRIAFNGHNGITVGTPGAQNRITQNAIFGNASLGIDLGNDGVTADDAGDVDAGPNGLQNFPVLTSTTPTQAQGTLDSTASTVFTLEFFANTSCSASGYGEGRTYLGSAPVSTDPAGHASFTVPLTVPAGQRVTATATDPLGNTSEFSLCAPAVPVALVVDPSPFAGSDGNLVLEPGEAVSVEPAWKNASVLPLALSGTASGFTGPVGPLYTNVDSGSDYGTIAAGATKSCSATPNCFAMAVSAPAIRPVPHWDASFTETLNVDTPAKTWVLHVGESFTDVPRSQTFYRTIETIFHNLITVGCTATTYCPADAVPRSQMALFLARGIAHGGGNVPASGNVNGTPYNCRVGGTSLFADVAPSAIYCKAVHYIAGQNVTSGCAPAAYCPDTTISRAQMAIFFARAIVAPAGGPGVPLTYGPDPVTGLSYSCDAGSPNLHFTDVSISDVFCKHAHFLWAKGIVSGCSATEYCPTLTVARDEMAKFLTNAFNVLLYGP